MSEYRVIAEFNSESEAEAYVNKLIEQGKNANDFEIRYNNITQKYCVLAKRKLLFIEAKIADEDAIQDNIFEEEVKDEI